MARQQRRVRTEPQPGVDPTPQKFPASADVPERVEVTLAEEDRDDSWGTSGEADSNDERLRDNIPPHNV
ncbi:hypothetical protein [Gulosibacter molinativorax]|uniref:Uncharacterized protein n=1 Tax=Gulosibacter molinativorax TaxID=256821 RepID=A0ABT7C8Q3_9MICO|nr:hypothetical protein [Gulosibacter molinativorax]MDJ1371475.1 hypothetical protein [Gulosibacter molinativorax]QUY62415.1 Hypotetical protein [Gulosibacter molinativorax]